VAFLPHDREPISAGNESRLPHDRELISAGNDGRLMRWGIADGKEQSPAASPHTPANCLAISPDGRWLAIGTGSWMKEEGGQIVIWELASMELIAEFSCSEPVGVLMFRPDSQTLAAGDFHGRVTFWDVPARKRLGTTLPRYKDAIAAAQFSRNTEAFAKVTTDDIARDPSWQLPKFFPWFSDRSTVLPKPAAPLASNRVLGSDAATNSFEPTDGDRLRHIREEIDALERDLVPTESTSGFDGSNGAFTQ
jgi:WD40 repeat protein